MAYDLARRPLILGERLLVCTDCGAYVEDSRTSAHDRFHRLLGRLCELMCPDW